VTRDLALKIIGDTAATQSDLFCNFPVGLPPTRLIHSFKKSAKDAPQDADRVALGRIAINVSV
jgi:hypothetical protein